MPPPLRLYITKFTTIKAWTPTADDFFSLAIFVRHFKKIEGKILLHCMNFIFLSFSEEFLIQVSVNFVHLLSWANLTHTYTRKQNKKNKQILLHYCWVVFCCLCLVSWVSVRLPLFQMMQYCGLLRSTLFFPSSRNFARAAINFIVLWHAPSTCENSKGNYN